MLEGELTLVLDEPVTSWTPATASPSTPTCRTTFDNEGDAGTRFLAVVAAGLRRS